MISMAIPSFLLLLCTVGSVFALSAVVNTNKRQCLTTKSSDSAELKYCMNLNDVCFVRIMWETASKHIVYQRQYCTSNDLKSGGDIGVINEYIDKRNASLTVRSMYCDASDGCNTIDAVYRFEATSTENNDATIVSTRLPTAASLSIVTNSTLPLNCWSNADVFNGFASQMTCTVGEMCFAELIMDSNRSRVINQIQRCSHFVNDTSSTQLWNVSETYDETGNFIRTFYCDKDACNTLEALESTPNDNSDVNSSSSLHCWDNMNATSIVVTCPIGHSCMISSEFNTTNERINIDIQSCSLLPQGTIIGDTTRIETNMDGILMLTRYCKENECNTRESLNRNLTQIKKVSIHNNLADYDGRRKCWIQTIDSEPMLKQCENFQDDVVCSLRLIIDPRTDYVLNSTQQCQRSGGKDISQGVVEDVIENASGLRIRTFLCTSDGCNTHKEMNRIATFNQEKQGFNSAKIHRISLFIYIFVLIVMPNIVNLV